MSLLGTVTRLVTVRDQRPAACEERLQMLSHRELRATMSPLVFTGLRRRQSVQEKGHTDKCHLHHQLLQAGGRGGAPPGLHQRRVRAGRAGRVRAGVAGPRCVVTSLSRAPWGPHLQCPVLCCAWCDREGTAMTRGARTRASGGLGNPRPALPAVQSLTARSCSWLVFLGGACSLQSCNPLWGGQSLYPARFTFSRLRSNPRGLALLAPCWFPRAFWVRATFSWLGPHPWESVVWRQNASLPEKFEIGTRLVPGNVTGPGQVSILNA